MRWKSGRRSENVEDQRGQRGSRRLVGGGIGLIIAVIAVIMGADPSQVIHLLTSNDNSTSLQREEYGSGQDELSDFVSVVLGDTEDTWKALFAQMNQTYDEPKLVLFSGEVQSACGFAQSATGPFYCPGDHKVYIDLSFYKDLKERFKAPGDFAQAYVIAHEVGHHVQNVLGILPKVHQLQQQTDQTRGNVLSVKLELQADCLAGVWAYHAQKMRNVIEEGDIEEALGAAASIGDDTLQKQAKGYVVPETFTHGTSEQRTHWFLTGFRNGDINSCDTFSQE